MSKQDPAQEAAAAPITHTLKKPIIGKDGRTHTVLTFRDPEMGDAIDAEEEVSGTVQETMFVLGRMCGLPFEDMRRMLPADFHAIVKKTDASMGNLEEDGENSPS
ncbi:phage tail assembly protein [Roseibium sp.]|uniref:phage tail assembly protein n=1 Tax=Roseibium sp. TaxID=1936156 RepID=UPI003B5157DA